MDTASQPGPTPTSRPPRSGPVIPHTLTWPKRLLARLVYCLIRVVAATLRYRVEFHPAFLKQPQPFVYAVWHNRLPLSILMYWECARKLGRPRKLAAMVSASKDGAIVARLLELFQTLPVRGSTSRRGPQALLELTRLAQQGYDLAITPDGPRGPCYVLQSGTIALGQLTGHQILPVSNYIPWKIRLKSWDRFQIPLPFSRAFLRFGEPLVIPRDATGAERESLRQELEKRLLALAPD